MSAKRSLLQEFLDGVESGEFPLSPLDGAMKGGQALADKASGYLGEAGKSLDARLGTARPKHPRRPDPISDPWTDKTPEQLDAEYANTGLFEKMGKVAPQIVANEMPLGFGGGGSGAALAAFPSPKQSLKRMQDEAVFRDTMEAKGARAVEPTAIEDFDFVPGLDASSRHPLRHDETIDGPTLRMRAAASSNDATAGGDRAMFGIGPADGLMGDVRAASQARPYKSEARISRPGPRDAERDFLEQYLSGLYGPRGK